MRRLLVADDDKFFRQVVARFLEAQGYAVVTAANGEEALAAAAAEGPALAVLDVALPLVPGDEVARRLPAGLPVVFVSGRDLDRLEGLDGARYRRLRKPADLDDLLEAIQGLLADA